MHYCITVCSLYFMCNCVRMSVCIQHSSTLSSFTWMLLPPLPLSVMVVVAAIMLFPMCTEALVNALNRFHFASLSFMYNFSEWISFLLCSLLPFSLTSSCQLSIQRMHISYNSDMKIIVYKTRLFADLNMFKPKKNRFAIVLFPTLLLTYFFKIIHFPLSKRTLVLLTLILALSNYIGILHVGFVIQLGPSWIGKIKLL